MLGPSTSAGRSRKVVVWSSRGGGHLRRPLDCAFESICETCTFFQTSIEFRPTLLAQHDDAAAKGQTHRAELFSNLLNRTNHVSEEGHEGLQAHAGVDEAGGVGMTQLMWGDPQRLPGGAEQPSGAGRVVDAAADPGGSDAGAGNDEQEVDRPAVAGVRQGTLAAADGHPCVEDGQGVGVEWNDAFGVELAERHLQPGAVPR